MIRVFEYMTYSSEETVALGAELAALLMPSKLPGSSMMMVLRGELGAGKTTLVKGIAAALGAAEPEEVTSPTFTLMHEYVGEREGREVRLYHLDLYRLETQRELATLGIEELMMLDSVVLVEWGEKFPWVMELCDGEIAMEHAGGDERRITIRIRET